MNATEDGKLVDMLVDDTRVIYALAFWETIGVTKKCQIIDTDKTPSLFRITLSGRYG
jgi:hypothetical protein